MENMNLRAPKGAVKKKKTVGRGDSAGKGSTCGRGHKGQNARSGGGVRPGFEGGQMPIYRRVARRGFSNYPFKKEVVGINLQEIEDKYANKETVSLETLKEKNIVKNRQMHVKILGDGELSKTLTFSGLPVSKSAREKIEKAGGTVEKEGQE
jgi:large subunit ribosomal protein L15